MKNFHSPGDTLPFVATADVASGDLVVVGDMAGVACGAVATGDLGQMKAEGVFTLRKDGNAIAPGSRVYATGTSGSVTATEGANTPIGFAHLGAAAGDPTVLVKLAL